MKTERLQELKDDVERGRKYDVPNDYDCNYEELYDVMEELIAAVEELQKRDEWLICLEQEGVDNWSGYEFAQKAFDEIDDA